MNAVTLLARPHFGSDRNGRGGGGFDASAALFEAREVLDARAAVGGASDETLAEVPSLPDRVEVRVRPPVRPPATVPVVPGKVRDLDAPAPRPRVAETPDGPEDSGKPEELSEARPLPPPVTDTTFRNAPSRPPMTRGRKALLAFYGLLGIGGSMAVENRYHVMTTPIEYGIEVKDKTVGGINHGLKLGGDWVGARADAVEEWVSETRKRGREQAALTARREQNLVNYATSLQDVYTSGSHLNNDYGVQLAHDEQRRQEDVYLDKVGALAQAYGTMSGLTEEDAGVFGKGVATTLKARDNRVEAIRGIRAKVAEASADKKSEKIHPFMLELGMGSQGEHSLKPETLEGLQPGFIAAHKSLHGTTAGDIILLGLAVLAAGGVTTGKGRRVSLGLGKFVTFPLWGPVVYGAIPAAKAVYAKVPSFRRKPVAVELARAAAADRDRPVI